MSQPGIDGFLHRLGEVLGTLQAAPGPVHRRIWVELGPWLRSLTVEAAPKWLSRLGAELPCHVIEADLRRPCARHAVALCMLCGRSTCLEHSFIDRAGEAICYVCASIALGQSRGHAQAAHQHQHQERIDPRTDERELVWARRTLKITAQATLDEAHARHRKLSAQWHPDRYTTDKQKADAERRFKDIQRAWDIVRKDFERRHAA